MKQKFINPTYKRLSSKVVYKGPFITVYEDTIIKPNNSKGIYSYVVVPQTVGIVPLDKENNIYLCRQYRYIFKSDCWGIPRGFANQGESSISAAERELKEEAGLVAQELTMIGSLKLSAGILNENCHVYLARNVIPLAVRKDEEKEIKKVEKFSFKKVLEMVEGNEIDDGLTVGAILKVNQLLSSS